jgi:hypothetical protein
LSFSVSAPTSNPT